MDKITPNPTQDCADGAARLLRFDTGAQLMEYAAGDELVQSENCILTKAAIRANNLALNLSRLLAFTYACLNASWRLLRKGTKGSEERVQWHLNIGVIIAPYCCIATQPGSG